MLVGRLGVGALVLPPERPQEGFHPPQRPGGSGPRLNSVGLGHQVRHVVLYLEHADPVEVSGLVNQIDIFRYPAK